MARSRCVGKLPINPQLDTVKRPGQPARLAQA